MQYAKFYLMSQFGDLVRKARIDKGWSQRELARRIKKSSTYIHYVERGFNPSAKDEKFQVGSEAVDALAKALDLDVNETRLAAGYAPNEPIEPGFFSGYHDLSPDRQELARRQIKAILDSLADKEHDTNYIDDE